MSLKKLGFVAITPAKVVDQDDLNSIGGYSKETINRLGGMTVGALAGTVVGGAAGATQGKRYARSGSGKIYSSVMNVVNRTAKGHGGGRPGFWRSLKAKHIPVLAGAGIGATIGGSVAGFRSTRKTEREAGVRPGGLLKYYGLRGLAASGGATAAGKTLGSRATIPGGLIADYIVSRKVLGYSDAPKKRKKKRSKAKKKK